MIGATMSVVRLVRCAPLGAMALLLGCSVLMAPATPPAPATARVRVTFKDGSVPPAGAPVNVSFERAPPNQGGIGRGQTDSDGVARVPIRFLGQARGQPRDSAVRIQSVSIDSSCFGPPWSGGEYGQTLAPGDEIDLEYHPSLLVAAFDNPDAERIGLQLHVASDGDAARAIQPAATLVQSMAPDLARRSARTASANLGSGPCAKYLPKTLVALSGLISELEAAVREQQRVEAETRSREAAAAEAFNRKQRSPECKIVKMEIDICHQQFEINLAQSYIDNEREVGARTGYVRPRVIHDSGQAILVLERQRDDLVRTLQSTYGVVFSPSSCRRPPDTVGELRVPGIPSELAAQHRKACMVPKDGS